MCIAIIERGLMLIPRIINRRRMTLVGFRGPVNSRILFEVVHSSRCGTGMLKLAKVIGR
jgi:hypothetical protein